MLSPKLFGIPEEEQPTTLWNLHSQVERNWGSKDYEMQVLAAFLVEFKQRTNLPRAAGARPVASHVATVLDQRVRASLGLPPEFARPRWAYWNDEIWDEDVLSGSSPVFGRLHGVAVAPGSDFFDAVPDARMPCSRYGDGVKCYHVTAAAMSLYLRTEPTRTPTQSLR